MPRTIAPKVASTGSMSNAAERIDAKPRTEVLAATGPTPKRTLPRPIPGRPLTTGHAATGPSHDRCSSRWWNQHRSVRLSSDVGPRRIHGMT